MSDVMTQCVPLSTGALSRDQRVNYQFGLVLGVDEFQQEDLYFRERDERAARTLHGYGTTVGLEVGAQRPGSAPDDVEVTVAPGVLVDQYGRPVVIPTAQCARVGAWLAAQEHQAAADEAASPLAEHLSPSGDLTLYIVAEYGSCLDALVPLPGNPCGSDDEVTAASRVRDSWQLGFRWEPPAMPHWDGVRALADLLLPIELHDDSPLESDEDLLAEHIRALAPGAPAPATPLPSPPILPRADARAALDRLLTIWITEVRPALAPDLIQPEGEEAVLLSTITVGPADPFDPEAPAITDFQAPDDEGRPYLAPSQLIQELVLLGGGPTEPEPLIQLASLSQIEVSGEAGDVPLLVLWAHIPDSLTMPATVQVSRNGQDPVPFTVETRAMPNTFALHPEEDLLPNELLEVQLDLTQLQVDVPDGTPIPLTTWLQQEGVDVLGREGDLLRLHHTVAPLPGEPDVPPAPPQKPVLELATASPILIDQEVPGVEVWFHVDKAIDVADERIERVLAGGIEVLAEADEGQTLVEIPFDRNRVRHNVYQLLLDQGTWLEVAGGSPYLRVVVHPEAVRLESFGGDVAEYAEARGILWHDTQEHTGTGSAVVLWVRMREVQR